MSEGILVDTLLRARHFSCFSWGMRTEKIIVADDHPIFRDGMCRMIADLVPGADIREAKSMYDVLESVETAGAPDLVFLDLLFPGMNPRETLPFFRRLCPKTSIVIVSMIDDENTINKIMTYGADGYIVKSIAAEEMQTAIVKIRAGDYVIARPQLAGLAEHIPVLGDMMDLTDRQREILSLIATGQSNKEIGRTLALSPFTVRNHVSLLFRILKVKSRAELARHASRVIDII